MAATLKDTLKMFTLNYSNLALTTYRSQQLEPVGD